MEIVKEIESGDEFNEIIKNNQNVFIDLYAEWCGPCKKISKPLEDIADKYKNIRFIKIDIDKLQFLDINIQEPEQIPCLLYIKNGEQVKKLVTSNIGEIEKNLEIYRQGSSL